MQVMDIHDERGYREVRQELARSHDLAEIEPDIQIVDVDLAGDRRLVLQHRVRNGVLLDQQEVRRVLRQIAILWGYPVRLIEVDATTDAELRAHEEGEPSQPAA
jgi:stage V sporulation protein R